MNPSNEGIRRTMEEVYSRPEFSQKGGAGWPEEIYQLLRRFFSWLGDLHITDPGLYKFLLIACIVLLVILVGHIAWTVARFFFTDPQLRQAGKTAEQRQRLSQNCWMEAQERAAQGDYTEAIRFLFLSLVYRLDENGRVNFQRSYTNREYLSLFEERPALGSQLAVFVDTLDDYWYGQRPAVRDQYQKCLALYERWS